MANVVIPLIRKSHCVNTPSVYTGGFVVYGIKCWTYDREIMGLTAGRVAVKWLLLG